MNVVIRCGELDCPLKNGLFCGADHLHFEVKENKIICHTKAQELLEVPMPCDVMLVNCDK